MFALRRKVQAEAPRPRFLLELVPAPAESVEIRRGPSFVSRWRGCSTRPATLRSGCEKMNGTPRQVRGRNWIGAKQSGLGAGGTGTSSLREN